MSAWIETYEATSEGCGSDAATMNDAYYPLAGHTDYQMAVCAIPSNQLRTHIKEITDQIRRPFPNHYYVPETYSHLTIASLGAAATAHTIARLHRSFNSRLEDISSVTKPINIVAEGINHFPNCIFAQVFDEAGALNTLHDSIRSISAVEEAFPFVPHITLSYYKERPHLLMQYIDTFFANTHVGTDTIESIYLTVMDPRRSMHETPYEIIDAYSLD